MSQFPPPSLDNYPAYAPPPSKVHGMALASMILGISAIPFVCVFGLGIVLGITAVVLGIVALGAINRNPEMYSGKGFAIAGIACGGGGSLLMVPLLIAILLPSLGKSRELANRATCAANLRGITQSMNVYGVDVDVYPLVGANYSSTLASALPGPTGPDTLLLSNKPGGLYTSAAPGNVCQSMWILVIGGMVSPKQFLCKSDPGTVASSPVTTATGDYLSNFANDQAYSYSFACPWSTTGMGGWWRSDTDASLPLIADIAPAQGTGSPAANTLDGNNKNANSFNHQRDGQNVGYGDGHAEFGRLASMGQNSDNIYSANGARGPDPRGITPSSAANPGIVTGPGGGSKGNWDVILVPAANGATHVRQ